MRWIVTIAVALAALALTATAQAAFPGTNGRIVYLTSDGHLFTISPDGSGGAQVPTPNDCGGRYGVSWSADGSLLATGACSGVAIMASDGSGYHTLNGGGPFFGSWSPDSGKLVSIGSCMPGCTVTTINADGTGEQVVAITDTAAHARWSPGGDQIAFSESPGLYTMTPTGQAITKIPGTGHGDRLGSWSPDGFRLAFTRPETGGAEDVYTIRKDGSGLEQLTSDGSSSEPAWSPDGRRIAFQSRREGSFGIFVMNADGSGQTRNTFGAGVYDIDWQPIPFTGHVRPRGASPFETYLVPAYNKCTAPNRTHGSPLAFPSCSPPQQASSFLTIGTPDANGQGAKSHGVVFMAVRSNPSDMAISISVTDVRHKADLTDYAGPLHETSQWRLTDHYNAPDLETEATTIDFSVPIDVPCGPTADASVGSTCAISTTANSVIPGAVRPGKRAVVELGNIQVYDDGSDPSTTDDNTLFLTQGLFVP